MPKKAKPSWWKNAPDPHDFPDAASYLSLLFPPAVTDEIVERLRLAETTHRKAKDLMRASGLALLPRTNRYVKRDLEKIDVGTLLSPVLLVRGDGALGLPLIVADGYHRICASYLRDEDVEIPCRLVGRDDDGT